MPDSPRIRLATNVLLALYAVVALLPIAWMIASSFKTDRELLDGPLFALGDAGFANYVKAFAARPFVLYLFNSIFAALVSVAITLVVGVCAAYAFAKLRNAWTEILWYAILASIMIPLEAIVIPLFLEVHSFGWQDTYAGIVIPTALNAAGIFILRQAIHAIPEELFDASRMDGASEPTIIWRVVVPIIRSNLMVVAVLTFSFSWNSYLWPLIVTTSDELRTLPLGMAAFQMTLNTRYSEIMAVSVFGTVPMALLFAFFQRYFIQSSISSAVKG
ncbi:MAG: carbohydrate ABC transporter permease [Rhizobiales bacterium]|nr:carbohydrate ABC transporter permease [Hyphomicrobiales bacterium]